jgi:hypothetical protein
VKFAIPTITRGKLLAGLGAVTLAGGLAVGTAFAADPTPTPNQNVQNFISKLAQKLGKTDTEVQTAITQTESETIDQAVKDGKLTQAQADQMKTRMGKGQMPFAPFGGMMRGRPGVRGGMVGFGAEQKAVTDYLGITAATLATDLKSGKSLADVAAATPGKSRDGLKTAIVDAQKARLDAAVKAGKLTQANADASLTKFSANVDKMLDAKHDPNAKPQRGARPAAPKATPAPTTTPNS